ncbi:MAG TPA: DUF222 domain-containing protein [Streptosporangiaceae bacterium]
MPDDQFESQEEILAASEAALTDEDIPPEDEAFMGPDPDCGMPAELLALSDAELAELLDAVPAQMPPPTWPLSYRTGEPGGFVPGDGPDTGTGFAQGGVLDELPASITLAGLTDDAYARAATLDDDSLVGTLRAWRRLASWATARELATITELARRRPAPGTPPASIPGQLPDQISEFTADEVGLALTLTRMAARTEFELALDLHARPAIAAALETGQIDLSKVRILTAMICPLEPAHADAVESAVLPRAPGLTTGELRAALQRAVLAVDPDAARRRQEASQKDARVERWTDPEGTATLAGRYLPPAEVLAADKRLGAIAKAWKKQGAQGGMDLLRAHAYLALLLGQTIDTPPPGLLPPTEATPPGPKGRHGPFGTPDWPDSPGTPDRTGPFGTPDRPGPFGTSDRPSSPGTPDRPGAPGTPGAPGPSGTPNRPSSPGTPDRPGPLGIPDERSSLATDTSGSSHLAPGGTRRLAGESVPAGLRQPITGVPLPPLTGEVHLTVPMLTLLGLADGPGEAAGFGPVHADTARTLADALATHRGTRWGVIITNQDGRAMGWGGGIRARPASAGGWKITLTTEPIAPYP